MICRWRFSQDRRLITPWGVSLRAWYYMGAWGDTELEVILACILFKGVCRCIVHTMLLAPFIWRDIRQGMKMNTKNSVSFGVVNLNRVGVRGVA